MKAIIIKVATGLVLTYFGWQLTDKGLSSPSDETLQGYEKLCKNSVKTEGILDSTYTETTFKILKGSTTLNNFTYTYKVNDQTYNGSYSIKGVPQKLTVDVWYDPASPGSHLKGDPCKQFEFSKARKYPGWYAFIGVPMLLIGAGLLYGLFKSGIRSLLGAK
jgi:hypothetical protein